jgi:hypothetical protein
MMFSDFSNDYLERAEECRTEARQASHAEERAEWFALADEWVRLAQMTLDDATAEELPGTVLKREAA